MSQTKVPFALKIMQENKSVEDRSLSFIVSVERSIMREIIDPLIIKKEKLEQQILDLKDFSLDTDINKGRQRVTAEDCEKRFKAIFKAEYDLELLNLEIDSMKGIYDKYFKVEPDAAPAT